MKAKTPPPGAPQKSFFRRMGVIVAVLALFAVLIAAAVFVFKRAAPEKVTAPTPVGSATVMPAPDLPGLRGQISERSRYQLETVANENSHVIAMVVIRYKYAKGETPFVYTWTRPKAKAVVDKIIADATKRAQGPDAMSSEEAKAKALKENDPRRQALTLRYSEEARLGLVKCVPISEVALTNPTLSSVATGICYATIPPFDPNTAIALVVLTDSSLEEYTEVTEMRRLLLMLQIDIFNRDFEGRETWAHE